MPANNFQANIAAGKMFTPLCFFCYGTPKYVYIDLKRSISNLTSGQGKGQCQRRRNCVKLYIIRLVLMGQGCLYYFVAALEQKADATNQTNAPFEKVISNI